MLYDSLLLFLRFLSPARWAFALVACFFAPLLPTFGGIVFCREEQNDSGARCRQILLYGARGIELLDCAAGF